ncbi:MAG: exonuclease domain-containing protein [Bacteroidales bacterium]|nr:exonuclease domain-containing protein [Bacteroidales bacterium]
MPLKLTRPLVFFDIEATGILIHKDRIIEIFLLRIDPDGKEHSMHQLFNPEMPIPPTSTAIHGIRDEDVANKPTFKDKAHEILQFIGNADLAGYNCLRFDVPLLVEEFLKCDIDFDVSQRRIIDVMNIFHRMEPRNLRAAYKFYCNKDIENAHTAQADTLATWEIFQAQLHRYENQPLPHTESEIFKIDLNFLEKLSRFDNNADLAGHIKFNDDGVEVFAFGKYLGESVEEVFKREPQYYDWIMKSQFPLSTKQVVTKIRLRMFNQGNNTIK